MEEKVGTIRPIDIAKMDSINKMTKQETFKAKQDLYTHKKYDKYKSEINE